MRADAEHLRLFLERQVDHWSIAVLNRVNGACLYSARCTSEAGGRNVLSDFASSELGKSISDAALSWVVDETDGLRSKRSKPHLEHFAI